MCPAPFQGTQHGVNIFSTAAILGDRSNDAIPSPRPSTPPPLPNVYDKCHIQSTIMSKKDCRVRFNENPVTEVHSQSPVSSTSSLDLSPVPLKPPLFPKLASSSLRNSPPPILQKHAVPFIPPPLQASSLCLHPTLVAPSLLYDVRFPPSQSNPHLSSTILATPASNPPLPSLVLRVGDLLWTFSVSPDAGLSPGKVYVTIYDVLLAIHNHLRTAVKSAEYEAMSKPKKAEVFREFERRVGSDPVRRGKGLRRVDYLNGRFCAQGLVPVHDPKGNLWNVVMCQLTPSSEDPDSGPAHRGSGPAH